MFTRCSVNPLLVMVAAVLLATSHARAQIPPLTYEQQVELESADDDDRGWSETAFRALVENVRKWSVQGIEGLTDVHAPDLDALLDAPSPHRGELFLLRGRIEQQSRLPEPYTDVIEWFVRDSRGRPMQVFIIDPADALPGLRFDDGSMVVLPARFYKRTEEVTRSGQTRPFAAFVGAVPRPDVPPWQQAAVPLWPIALLVAVALLIFAVLFIYVRRLRRLKPPRTRPRPTGIDPRTAPPAVELPDDPADALAELHRRADQAQP